MAIRQKHGISGAVKVSTTDNGYTQAVVVTDEYAHVRLGLGACAYPADMTPDQARFIAKCLSESADRVEDAIRERQNSELLAARKAEIDKRAAANGMPAEKQP